MSDLDHHGFTPSPGSSLHSLPTSPTGRGEVEAHSLPLPVMAKPCSAWTGRGRERGYAVPVLAQPTRVVIKAPFPHYPEANFNEGVRLHLCNLRLSYQPQFAGIKHLNRLENVMARMEWTDNTITDGLLLDEKDRAIECTMSNVFARFGKSLVTPDLSLCGVAGITRGRILRSLGDRCIRRQTSPSQSIWI